MRKFCTRDISGSELSRLQARVDSVFGVLIQIKGTLPEHADMSVAAPRLSILFFATTWGSRPRLIICRPLRGLICYLITLFLGLTPQAKYFSPLRGSALGRIEIMPPISGPGSAGGATDP